MAADQPLRALKMIFHAAEAALWTGNLAGVVRCGHVSEAVDAGSDRDAQLLRDINVNLASLFTGADQATESLHSLVTSAQDRSDPDWLILTSETALALGRFGDAGMTARRAVDAARESKAQPVCCRRRCIYAHSPNTLKGGTPRLPD